MKLPDHKCGLFLTHNEHRNYYESAEKFIVDRELVFADEDAKARAIATDEIWELQWYPDTPIGSYTVAAPTLDEVLALAATAT